ncbi:MAG: uroporphyrinogen-III C-methyltransferase [Pseudomonadota bacterium]
MDIARIAAIADKVPRLEPGSVCLLGAGPGDPRYLTLEAAKVLGEADAVVHDALVDPRVLDLTRSTAERHFVGKRGGQPSIKQPAISAMLVRLALEGRRVVRLKGGDPLLFGRAAEEIAALNQAGVAWRAVPGVTVSLAALSGAGIPATVDGVNRAIVIATGHSLEPGPGALDWEALARLGQPLLIYMAVARVAEICRRLERGGLPAETPAAVFSSVGMAGSSTVFTTLGRLPKVAQELGSPAILAIGGILPRVTVGADWGG